MSSGDYLLLSLNDVVSERMRQIEEEGHNAANDDGYVGGELAAAGGCYAFHAAYSLNGAGGGDVGGPITGVPVWWPWDASWWKPDGERKNLVRAAALIMAEIDRYDRKHGTKTSRGEGTSTSGNGSSGVAQTDQAGSGSDVQGTSQPT